MSGCNRSVVFPFEDFELFGFEDMPKGECLRMGVNPYNGKVVFSFQDVPGKRDVIERIIHQISRDVHSVSRMNGKACGLREFADLCDDVIHKSDLDYYGLNVLALDAALRRGEYRRQGKIAS